MSFPLPKKILQLLETSREAHAFSAYQLFCERGGDVLCLSGGVTGYWPNSAPVTDDTYFDLGSITKSVFTTTVIARFVESGQLRLDQTAGELCADLASSRYSGLTIFDLLNHGAGLVDCVDLPTNISWESLAPWFRQHESECIVDSPGKIARYSDAGFLILGLVLRRFGELETLFRREVVTPLALPRIQFGPLSPEKSVADTEFSTVRGRLLHGEVFDENTYRLGGVATQAGLFCSAPTLAVWAREWLAALAGQSKFLGRPTAELFTRRTNKVPGSTWALGFDTRSSENSTAGKKFSSKSFGHLGFPGTSIWFDPEKNGFAIFFTNRVHPSRVDSRIRTVRPALHDLVAEYWSKNKNE